jgi:glycosyltransferase WbpL
VFLSIVLTAIAAGTIAFGLCLAIRNGLLPFIPLAAVNARSLHDKPVHTSAGIAIIAALVTVWVARAAVTGEYGFWPVMTGAAILAATGFADDIKGLTARFRFGIQAIVVASLLLIWWPAQPPLNPILAGVLFVGILWFINLFNFMDGADGLATSQTIIAVLPLLAWSIDSASGTASDINSTLAALLAAGAAFLVFNWPKASLFMGDSGSLAIPFVVAAAALFHPDPGTAILLVLTGFSPFIADASLTLAIRVLSRDKWWVAHRTHAYQLAAMRVSSHRLPLYALWAYGLLWLLPASMLYAGGMMDAVTTLAAAYIPVVACCGAVQWRLRRNAAA